jgi:hypothetical protein
MKQAAQNLSVVACMATRVGSAQSANDRLSCAPPGTEFPRAGRAAQCRAGRKAPLLSRQPKERPAPQADRSCAALEGRPWSLTVRSPSERGRLAAQTGHCDRMRGRSSPDRSREGVAGSSRRRSCLKQTKRSSPGPFRRFRGDCKLDRYHGSSRCAFAAPRCPCHAVASVSPGPY